MCISWAKWRVSGKKSQNSELSLAQATLQVVYSTSVVKAVKSGEEMTEIVDRCSQHLCWAMLNQSSTLLGIKEGHYLAKPRKPYF